MNNIKDMLIELEDFEIKAYFKFKNEMSPEVKADAIEYMNELKKVTH